MAIDLVATMVELAAVCGEVTEWPVFDHPPKKVTQVPALIVSYPSNITYNVAGGSGLDRMTVGLVVVVSRTVDRVAHTELGGFASGAGAGSLRVALEDRDEWETIEGISVQGAEFDVITIAGTEYLAVVITADVVG